MALDGVFLRHIKKEIETVALNSRVEKIHQPNKEEIILSLRNRKGSQKLLISSRANSPRIHFQFHQIENPKVPPMFCMLLRKRLSSAKLVSVRQIGLERVLFLDFDAVNELGDEERLSLVIEIMGKYSNIILVDEKNVVIDSIKRVNAEMSSKRLVLPGVKYNLPPSQDKICILDTDVKDILKKIIDTSRSEHLNKSILKNVQGLSPIVCREIEYLVDNGENVLNNQLSYIQNERLLNVLGDIKKDVVNIEGTPYMILDSSNKPLDISFIKINQYPGSVEIKSYETFSSLLDEFYFEKDTRERMRSRSQDLLKKLSNLTERLNRKIALQNEELILCLDREKFRIWADIINANLYSIDKGVQEVELQNFYDINMSKIKIKLDPSLSASQNAQRYYKKYQKLKTAENILNEEIKKANTELIYLESVLDVLSRIKTESELLEIKEELIGQGYLKRSRKTKSKNIKESLPIETFSSDGFKIFIGRNNRQNDKLTLRLSSKDSMWFHVKNIPGSHVVVVCDDKKISDTAIFEAAVLAARHSKAANSSQVPVDYTKIKNVSKPNGAKPGMVVYVNYKTVYVTP